MSFNPLIAPARAGFIPSAFSSGDAGFTSLPTQGDARPADPGPPEDSGPPVDVQALVEAARSQAAAEERARLAHERAELEQLASVLSAGAADLARLHKQTLDRAAGDIADLILALTRRLLGDSLVVHPDALPTLIHRALERFPEKEDLRIRVPADLAEAVREAVDPGLKAAVEADPGVSGGCVLESRHGSVDATVDAAMEGVEEAVQAWLEATRC